MGLRLLIIFAIISLSLLQGALLIADEAAINAAYEKIRDIETRVAKAKVRVAALSKQLEPKKNLLREKEKNKNDFYRALLAQGQEGNPEKQKEYQIHLKNYFDAADAVAMDAARLDIARNRLAEALADFQKAREDHQVLRKQAHQELTNNEPLYLKRVVAFNEKTLIYEATWVDPRVLTEKRLDILRQAADVTRKEIEKLKAEGDDMILDYEVSTKELTLATRASEEMLDELMRYDFAVDVASKAVDIAIDSREMGAWAFPYHAIQEGVGVFLREPDYSRGMGVYYDTINKKQAKNTFGEEILKDTGHSLIKKSVVELIEIGMGSEQIVGIWGDDFYSVVESVLVTEMSAGKGKSGDYKKVKKYWGKPLLGDWNWKKVRSASAKTFGSSKWWTGGVGKDLMIDAAKGLGIKVLKTDAATFASNHPKVIRMLEIRGRHHFIMKSIMFNWVRREAARKTLAFLQDLVESHQNGLEESNRPRHLVVSSDEIMKGETLTLKLYFTGDVDNVKVKLSDDFMDVTRENGIWTATTSTFPKLQNEEIKVWATAIGSGKKIDGQPMSVASKKKGESSFNNYEELADTSHLIRFFKGIPILKSLEVQMAGKIIYSSWWENLNKVARRKVTKVSQTLAIEDIKDCEFIFGFSEDVEEMMISIGSKQFGAKKSEGRKIHLTMTAKDLAAACQSDRLVIDISRLHSQNFDPDPSSVARIDPKNKHALPGHNWGPDRSHYLKIGRPETVSTKHFYPASIITLQNAKSLSDSDVVLNFTAMKNNTNLNIGYDYVRYEVKKDGWITYENRLEWNMDPFSGHSLLLYPRFDQNLLYPSSDEGNILRNNNPIHRFLRQSEAFKVKKVVGSNMSMSIFKGKKNAMKHLKFENEIDVWPLDSEILQSCLRHEIEHGLMNEVAVTGYTLASEFWGAGTFHDAYYFHGVVDNVMVTVKCHDMNDRRHEAVAKKFLSLLAANIRKRKIVGGDIKAEKLFHWQEFEETDPFGRVIKPHLPELPSIPEIPGPPQPSKGFPFDETTFNKFPKDRQNQVLEAVKKLSDSQLKKIPLWLRRRAGK